MTEWNNVIWCPIHPEQNDCNKAVITSLLEGITPISEPIEVIPIYIAPEEYKRFFSEYPFPINRQLISKEEAKQMWPEPAEPAAETYQADDAVVPYHPDASLPHDHAACEQARAP